MFSIFKKKKSKNDFIETNEFKDLLPDFSEFDKKMEQFSKKCKELEDYYHNDLINKIHNLNKKLDISIGEYNEDEMDIG